MSLFTSELLHMYVDCFMYMYKYSAVQCMKNVLLSMVTLASKAINNTPLHSLVPCYVVCVRENRICWMGEP